MQAAFTTRRPSGLALASRSRGALVVRAAVAAQPAKVTVKTADGAEAGTEELALGVAPATTAKGLVHRYLVYVQQNARQVRAAGGCVLPLWAHRSLGRVAAEAWVACWGGH
jgi:hypothetical protein